MGSAGAHTMERRKNRLADRQAEMGGDNKRYFLKQVYVTCVYI